MSYFIKRFCIALSLFVISSVSYAQNAPLVSYDALFRPTLGLNGMVVSQEYNASEAGLAMLKKGGNAVDAAVATGFALAVTHPQAGNIGGGGFMMIYIKELDKVIAVDYREMAPSRAHRDMFLDGNGNADDQKARWSMQSSGVPGTVAGLVHILNKYGTLSLSEVLAPAIQLAEEGFPVSWPFYASLTWAQKRLKKNTASAGYFYKADGGVYQPGELLIQRDLANTLRTIALKGAKGFYEGEVADKIVAAMEAGAGLITHDDLKNYKVVEREPITGTFRDYKIVSMPPPSSGGIHLVEMLNVLEGYDLKAMGHNSAAYIHSLTETMKYAYADRSKYLGDADFVDVPVKALTDKAYAASIRAKIDPNRAIPSSEIAPAKDLAYESNETTHFSVADKFGNMIASTYTLNTSFGNGMSVAGAGFLLNNEMDDFSAKPGSPNAYGLIGGESNAIAAAKRPLSSMTPTLVFKDGKPFIATGSPGGSTIITITLQQVLNMTEFDMNAMAANAAPRIHHQWLPDKLFIEPGISADTIKILESMGHIIPLKVGQSHNNILGSVQSIMLKDGVLAGAADPRSGNSHAAAY
jgi:gamma-glutamyltranspeptidase / glutathione hydrolase